jgi:hypothetical protein
VSVSVDVEELGAQIERFGTAPYLLTTGSEGRPHATHVAVAWHGGAFECSAGRKTAANIAASPGVCLLWAPFERGGYSLIVDGRAEAHPAGEGDTATVRIEPARAVLHRNALGDGYQADCVRLD